MSSNAVKVIRKVPRQVKPLLSASKTDAKKRVIQLYKAWYRQIPYLVTEYDIPKNEKQCRERLKEMFLKNRHVEDIRVIDMLVIKGQMELQEVANYWKQKHGVMDYWREEVAEPKSKDFLSKFLEGHN